MERLELAQSADLHECNAIICEGRDFQREQGFTQWTDDYPSLGTIRADIEAKNGYVIKADGRIAGYMCVDFGGEPAYGRIQGAWSARKPYAVIHRMAFGKDYRGSGLSRTALRLAEELCLSRGVEYIRVDTDFPNTRMQHILEKNGFRKCGTVVFQGGEKLAYDKIL